MEYRKNSFEQPIGFPVSDWKQCTLPPRTAMSGKWCRVEILDPEKHAEELFAAYVKKEKIRIGPICLMGHLILLKIIKSG